MHLYRDEIGNFPTEHSFMRNLLLWSTIFLLSTFASAQIPTKGNAFFGYSYERADLNSGSGANLNGWDGSLEGSVLPHVGIVVDVSGHYGQENFPILCIAAISAPCPSKVSASVHNFLFGPRVSIKVGKYTPFAHVLIGASHINGSNSLLSNSDTSLGLAYGGGIDYRLARVLGWRTQIDLLQTRFFSNTQNNVRLSTGLVLHF